MKLGPFVLAFLITVLSVAAYSYVLDMAQPTIDLYTIPMVEGTITCTVANENNCLATSTTTTKE